MEVGEGDRWGREPSEGGGPVGEGVRWGRDVPSLPWGGGVDRTRARAGELPDEAEHAQGHWRGTGGQQTGRIRSVRPPARCGHTWQEGSLFHRHCTHTLSLSKSPLCQPGGNMSSNPLALCPLTSTGWVFLVPRPLGGPKCPWHHAPVHPGLCLEGSRALPMLICLNVSRDSSGGARGRGQA